MFEQEMGFFKENQNSLVEKYKGKYLVIKGKMLVGAYDNSIQAFNDASKKFTAGTFMIQACVPGSEAYTVTISSNEIISLK